jgi:hypothetical protein
VRFNPVIQAYFEKLRTSGKAKKVAYCACERKLLHSAFALVKNGEVFSVKYTAPTKPSKEQSTQTDPVAARPARKSYRF